MATAAVSTSKGDVGTGIDCKTIILVLDNRSGNVYTVGGPHVESIGVVSTLGVTQGVIDMNIVKTKVGGLVNTEGLDRGVENVQSLDVGVLERVGAEELGLGFATVASLGIPPSLALAIDGVTSSSLDEKIVSGKRDQWACPFFVTKGSLSLEDNL